MPSENAFRTRHQHVAPVATCCTWCTCERAIFPHGSLLTPGQTATLKAKRMTPRGNFIREKACGAVVGRSGERRGGRAGRPRPRRAGIVGRIREGHRRHAQRHARVRVIEAPPWTFDFETRPAAPPAWWVGAPTKVVQRTVEGVGKVLVRPRDDTVGRRAKVFFGQPNLTDSPGGRRGAAASSGASAATSD